MVIKASKIRIIGWFFFIIFVFVFILSLVSIEELSKPFIEDALVTSLGIALFMSFIKLLSGNYDIEVTSDEEMIGGQTCSQIYLRKQQFISKKNINRELSSERNLYNRIIGQFKIYDINGQGFRLNKHFFSKENFGTIQRKLNELFEITIT